MQMLLWIIRPLRLLATAVRSNDSPRQIACGFTVGAILGLLPKDNATAFAVGVLILSTRVNHAAALLATFIFSWIGLGLDSLADGLGYLLLTWPFLEPAYRLFFELPVARWTALNNSIVLGQLVIGCISFLPIYILTLRITTRHGQQVAQRVQRWRLYQLLFGTDLASSWRLR